MGKIAAVGLDLAERVVSVCSTSPNAAEYRVAV